jgi:type I restriction-modification system DNA methylase subunit
MNEHRRIQLSANMMVCNYTVRNLLSKIAALEANAQVPVEEKLSEIKKIKDEITKVGTEIDSIKKEITLLNSYNLN